MQSREKKRTGRKPGPNAGKGRKKGVPNKITADMRAIALAAFHKGGGEDWLVEQMSKNPAAMLSLFKALIPSQVNATVEQHTTITIQERRQKALELIEAAFGNSSRRVDTGNATTGDGQRLH